MFKIYNFLTFEIHTLYIFQPKKKKRLKDFKKQKPETKKKPERKWVVRNRSLSFSCCPIFFFLFLPNSLKENAVKIK